MYMNPKVGTNTNTKTSTSTDNPKPPVKQIEYFHQTSTVENNNPEIRQTTTVTGDKQDSSRKKRYIDKIPEYNPKEVVDSSNVVHPTLDTPKPSQEQKPSVVTNSMKQAETTEPSKKNLYPFSQKLTNSEKPPSDNKNPAKKNYSVKIISQISKILPKKNPSEKPHYPDMENPGSSEVSSEKEPRIPEFTLMRDAVTNTINTFKQQRDELLADNEQTIKVLKQNTQNFLNAQAFSITDLTSLIDAAQDSEQVESGKDEDKEFIQNQLQQKQAKIAAYKAKIIQQLTTELSKNLKPEVIKAFTDKISASLDLYQKNRSTCMIFDKFIKHAEKKLELAIIANKTQVELESGNISSTREPLEKYLHTKFAQINNNANPRITETLYPETCKIYIFHKMIRFGADKQFALYINKLTPEELEFAAFILFTNEEYAKTKGECYKDNHFTGQFRPYLAQAYRPKEDVTKPCKTLYIPENGGENPENFDLTKKHTRLELTDAEKKLFADLNSSKFDPSTGLGKIIYTIGPDGAPHFNMLNPFLCFLLLTYTERPFVSTEENNLRQELSQINLFNPIHIDIYETYINKKYEFDKLFSKLLSAAGTLLISEFDGDDCRNYVSGA